MTWIVLLGNFPENIVTAIESRHNPLEKSTRTVHGSTWTRKKFSSEMLDCDLERHIAAQLVDVRIFLFIYLFIYLFILNSKSRPFRRNSTIEQQGEQWAARIMKVALGNVAAGSIQLRRHEVSASTQERRAMYGGGGRA